jgi:hypothetical protein
MLLLTISVLTWCARLLTPQWLVVAVMSRARCYIPIVAVSLDSIDRRNTLIER